MWKCNSMSEAVTFSAPLFRHRRQYKSPPPSGLLEQVKKTNETEKVDESRPTRGRLAADSLSMPPQTTTQTAAQSATLRLQPDSAIAPQPAASATGARFWMTSATTARRASGPGRSDDEAERCSARGGQCGRKPRCR